MHTKGPLGVEKKAVSYAIVDKDGQIIGGVFGAENAKLWAASPDLLAALKRMMAMWEMMMKKVNHGASFYDAKTITEMNGAPLQAMEVIQRVEGKKGGGKGGVQ